MRREWIFLTVIIVVALFVLASLALFESKDDENPYGGMTVKEHLEICEAERPIWGISFNGAEIFVRRDGETPWKLWARARRCRRNKKILPLIGYSVLAEPPELGDLRELR